MPAAGDCPEAGPEPPPALIAWRSSEANAVRLAELNRSEAHRAQKRDLLTTHGLARHPLYGTWHNMMDRCTSPGDAAWRNYGGRGIAVCERWHDVATFIADIEAEIGPRPEGKTPSGKRPLYSLDRINVNGNYEPGNVQWATWGQQRVNQRAMIGNELAEAPDTGMECPTCGEPMTSLSAFDRHYHKEHSQPRSKAS